MNLSPEHAFDIARAVVGVGMIVFVWAVWPRFVDWLQAQGFAEVAVVAYFAPLAFLAACLIWPMVMLYPFIQATFAVQWLLLHLHDLPRH